jgi:hypothetical protein
MKPLPLAALLLLSGCAAPNPIQVRLSLLSVSRPAVTVLAAPPEKAADAPGAAPAARDRDAMTVSPDARGVTILVDGQFALPNGGGTASTNSVLSGISLPAAP